MKQLLSISAFLLFVQSYSFGQATNIYGNFNWISDHIYGYHYTSDVGPQIRQSTSLDTTVQVKREILDDSSAYSRLRYWLGGNANQRLRADLMRPFSKAWMFEFVLDRKSYPGWMDASFSRETDIVTSLSYGKNQGFFADINISFKYLDREMNGGLTGNSYSIEESQAGFSSLTSDVWFTDAFSRKSTLNLGTEMGYKWKSEEHVLSLIYKPSLSLDRFKYEDLSSDSVYLSQFEPGFYTDEAVVDSNRLLSLSNEVWLRYVPLSDSVAKKSLSVGVGHTYFEYFSNGVVDHSNNVYVSSILAYSKGKFDAHFDATYFALGFSQNDLNSNLNLTYKLYDYADSNRSRDFTLGMNADYRLNNPSLIYLRYGSSLTTIRSEYSKINNFSVEPFGQFTTDRLTVKLGVKYQSVTNWVYFDQTLTTNQFQGSLDVIAPNIGFSYKGTNLQLDLKGTHQAQNTPLVYSLPEWIGEMNLGIRFPLFKKKVYLTGGVDGWYFSDYYARGYVPMFDMMYVQSGQLYGNYLQLNPYIKANIQTVDVKLGFINANYGLTSDNPIVGPNYPSVPRMIQFAVDWNFKN